MKKFSIPYTKGIGEIGIDFDLVSDLYFSDGLFKSARDISLSREEKEEIFYLKKVLGMKLNYLINPSFYDLDFYLNLKNVFRKIEILKEVYDIDFLTLNNTYLIAIYEFRKLLFDLNIEIKLSVNCRVDSLEKLKLFHQDFAIKHFYLDRNLNRNYEELKKCIKYAMENNLNISLLVNEGCLPNCPYKKFCDDLVVFESNLTDEEKRKEIQELKHNIGCVSDFQNEPWRGLQSPWISPLWVDYYDYVDFKIAGRNKHKFVLKEIIDAYFNRKGNLQLYKAFSTFRVYDNITFYDLEEFDFFSHVKNCKLNCHSCSFCKNVYLKLMEEKYA